MVTDVQVRKLWKLLAAGAVLAMTARKTGMDEKTARKYRSCPIASLADENKTLLADADRSVCQSLAGSSAAA